MKPENVNCHCIVGLSVENVKKIKAVEITPSGNMVVIGGKNGAGKTSLIDAIAMALGGSKRIPGEPVRKGQSRAEIVLDLGGIVVTRIITHKGTTLKVETEKGVPLGSPQKVLDALVGTLTFDPLEFSRLKADRRATVLKQLAGLDFASADGARAEYFAERTVVKRDADKEQARLEGLTHHDDAPEMAIALGDLMEELDKARAVNMANAEVREEAIALGRDVATQDRECDLIQDKIRELTEHLKVLEGARATLIGKRKAKSAEADKLTDVDLSAIQEKITASDEINRKVRENAAHDKLKQECKTLTEKSDTLTKKLDKIKTDKAKALQEANFPVKGLGLNDAGVTYRDIPFEQCSSAEQLRISIAMSIALNPKLRIMLIRDGSLLDEDSLKLVADMAKAADAQVWIERVSEGDEVSVIIEDGTVKVEAEPVTKGAK